MQFGKTTFMLILGALIVLPFFIYKMIWLYNSIPATGTMSFMGKTLNGQFSSEYPVIRFNTNGKNTVFFNGNEGAEFKVGELVSIRYQKNNFADARINQFTGIWLDTILYAIVPFTVLLVIFLHPGIIPRKSKIIVGKKPFIQII